MILFQENYCMNTGLLILNNKITLKVISKKFAATNYTISCSENTVQIECTTS